MSFDVFVRDISRMYELMGDEVIRVQLLGGEPLLHPQISMFVEALYYTFPNADRRILTNGILLKNMGASFWGSVKSTNTMIHVSSYPPVVLGDLSRQSLGSQGVVAALFRHHG